MNRGLSCDICINNTLALHNTRLMATYASIDPRVRAFGSIIKYWAKQRRINEPYQGTLSSYAYILLAINFLQLRNPPILPNLQRMYPDHPVSNDDHPSNTSSSGSGPGSGSGGAIHSPVWIDGYDCYFYSQADKLRDYGKANQETLGELLAAFFRFYCCEFEWEHQVVSVRTASLLSKAEKQWNTPSVRRDHYYFAIEDPFEVTHNLGRLVDPPNLKVLKYEFTRAYKLICQQQHLQDILQSYQDDQQQQQ